MSESAGRFGSLWIPKFLFGHSRLFENRAKGPDGNIDCVHRDVHLSTVAVPQNNVSAPIVD